MPTLVSLLRERQVQMLPGLERAWGPCEIHSSGSREPMSPRRPGEKSPVTSRRCVCQKAWLCEIPLQADMKVDGTCTVSKFLSPPKPLREGRHEKKTGGAGMGKSVQGDPHTSRTRQMIGISMLLMRLQHASVCRTVSKERQFAAGQRSQ